MKAVWSADHTAVKIYGDHSPHPIIAEKDVVDELEGTTATFHTLIKMRQENLLPRPNASECYPYRMRDLYFAQLNKEAGYRKWVWGTVYRGRDFMWGYHYMDDGVAVFTDGTRF